MHHAPTVRHSGLLVSHRWPFLILRNFLTNVTKSCTNVPDEILTLSAAKQEKAEDSKELFEIIGDMLDVLVQLSCYYCPCPYLCLRWGGGVFNCRKLLDEWSRTRTFKLILNKWSIMMAAITVSDVFYHVQTAWHLTVFKKCNHKIWSVYFFSQWLETLSHLVLWKGCKQFQFGETEFKSVLIHTLTAGSIGGKTKVGCFRHFTGLWLLEKSELLKIEKIKKWLSFIEFWVQIKDY